MGSKEKSIQDKLKLIFRKNPPAAGSARNELALTAELERELSSESPLHRRLRAIREVSERALLVCVPEGGVEKLWIWTRDLLEDSNTEARHAVIGLMCALAEGQADHLQIMRTIYFRYLCDTHSTHLPEDTQLRFKLLHTLTNSGKNINCFEEEIGPFVLEWLSQSQSPPLLVEFLQLLINVVKFNAAYLDEHIVHGIVESACALCLYVAEGGVVASSLALLEAVVSYSLLPRAALPTFVAALCRAVNLDHYCQNSWKLMRDVMGADIGHAALHEMVNAPADGRGRCDASGRPAQRTQRTERAARPAAAGDGRRRPRLRPRSRPRLRPQRTQRADRSETTKLLGEGDRSSRRGPRTLLAEVREDLKRSGRAGDGLVARGAAGGRRRLSVLVRLLGRGARARAHRRRALAHARAERHELGQPAGLPAAGGGRAAGALPALAALAALLRRQPARGRHRVGELRAVSQRVGLLAESALAGSAQVQFGLGGGGRETRAARRLALHSAARAAAQDEHAAHHDPGLAGARLAARRRCGRRRAAHT